MTAGRRLFSWSASILAATTLAATSAAQETPFNSSFVGSYFDAASVYGDIWGHGNYAYLARWTQSQIDIVDVSTPGSPSLVTTFDITGVDDAASAQDVKTGVSMIGGKTLLFISLESGGDNGIQIVDVTTPASPVSLTTINAQPGTFNQFIHNTFYDNGWLYMSTSSDPTVTLVDLRTYDPAAAPAAIGAWDYQLTGVGNVFVHDITVQNDVLYASAWDRLVVYDVSSLDTLPPQYLGEYRGFNTHSAWATDDGEWVITAEERGGGAIRLHEVTDNGSSVTLVQRDSFVGLNTDTLSAHNPLIAGDRIYVSFYQKGGLVLEIDRTSKTLELVASYDTSTAATGGFAGQWGIFPFLGEDTVLMSDIETGFSIADFSAIQISWDAVRPQMIVPFTPTTLQVTTTEIGNSTLDAGSLTLNWTIDGGSPGSVVMSPIGGDSYTGDLPATACGARIDYWITVDDNQTRSFSDPATAPTDTHVAYVNTGLTNVFTDDFTTDKLWGVVSDVGLTSGEWTRDDPLGTGAQPDEGDPEAADTSLFFTGQGTNPDMLGEADVDGGPTTLTSPVMDFSAGDGLISYAQYFFASATDGDNLLTEITNDGSNWVTVEDEGQKAGGWINKAWRISDFVAPSSLVQVRFTTIDQGSGGIVEAAIDTFSADRLLCEPAALAASRNGTGSNPNVFTTSDVPVLGTTWSANIDIVSTGADAGVIAIAIGGPTTFPLGASGELLVLPPILKPNDVDAGGVHDIPIPADPSFLGLTFYLQGAGFTIGGSPSIAFYNAIDITLGF